MVSSACLLLPSTSTKRNPILRTHTWVPLAHTPTEIRARLLSNRTSFVALSVERFHRRSFHDLRLRIAKTHSPPEVLLREYFHAFNAIFFFNALTDRLCTFVVMGRACAQWRTEFAPGGERRMGVTVMREQAGLKRRTQVEVGIVVFERVDDRVDEVEKLRAYLGAMLAEMTRAFLGVYACGCDECDVRDGDSREEAWYRVAVWIEGFAKEKLGLDLDVVGDREMPIDRESTANQSRDRLADWL